jgi:transaldolase
MAITPLQSLIATGTKLWLDSVDPDEVAANRALGATGATSNPIIISDLIKTGRFDDLLSRLMRQGLDDEAIAWQLTDHLVRQAQEVFRPSWEATRGDDGYVSFELDPLLEDRNSPLSVAERTERYIALGKQWSKGHNNRMIKVPATPAGLAALEELSAVGVTINVTLVFGQDQYRTARDAIWRGAQRRPSLERFKSVYSIFVSRLDVYTAEKVPELSPAAQGQVGIVNAKRIWQLNQQFWADKRLPLNQEMIFASTGTKRPEDPPWKYVEAFAGSDIETNPPATNHKVQESGRTFTRQVDKMPPPDVLAEIDAKVDMERLESTLMEEGLKKFADPQHALLRLIASKRGALTTAGALTAAQDMVAGRGPGYHGTCLAATHDPVARGVLP